jgi:hypothetical protein
MNELTERRQRLLDAIRAHGPEHFNMGAVLEDQQDWTQGSYATFDFARCGTTGCLMGHAGVVMAQQYGIDLSLSSNDDDGIAEFFGLDTEWFWDWNNRWPEHVQEVYMANLPPADAHGYIQDRVGIAVAEWMAIITLLEDLIKEEA